MDEAERLVNELYLFRDHYFEQHPLKEANLKAHRIDERIKKCVEAVDKLEGTVNDATTKSRLLLLRGRALNATPEASPLAERALANAVKLDPGLVDAWNELGESYWKAGDVENARTCFEGALAHSTNKVSLRSLSVVFRQKAATAATAEEKIRLVEAGLSRAREAVQLSTIDGVSWSVLGNAYLSHFFCVSQNPRTIKQAMSAYKQAEKDPVANGTAELHYNKGIAQKYEEDYVSACASFARASALDPTWSQPETQLKNMLKTLTDIKNLIELKGKLKPKRLHTLLASISGQSCLSPSVLGPLAASSSVSLAHVADLVEGTNKNKLIVGKVVCSVHTQDTVPFTFCMCDSTGRCLAVNLYNLAPGKGVIIGDTVAIPEPHLTRVDVHWNDAKPISFDLLRVESPLALIINGRKSSPGMQAGVEMATFTKSD